MTVGSWDNYGVYSYTRGYNASRAPYCHMYYSNSVLNWGDPDHQRFSLMKDSTNPYTYYIGFEENLGINAT